MNQILSVENTSKNKSYKQNRGPLNINTTLKIFATCIMIFGIFMVGSGSYSMYKNSKNNTAKSGLTINVDNTSERQATIKVKSLKELELFTYKWSNDDEVQINCQGQKNATETVKIPTGTNTLSVYVKDIDGDEKRYQKTYTIDGNINIEFSVDGNNIKVTASGKNELSYMTYRWDEDDEQQVDISDMTTEQKIEIPKGLHELTVVVVDVNNETETKKQEVNGVTKPKLEVTTDGGDNFIIIATDEQGLKKVEFIINEDEKYMLNLDGRTELEYAYPLHDGENRLEVRVYNINDISEVSRVLVNK